MKKPLGNCPFCDTNTRAMVVEENTFRRDMCRCDNCGETIYPCRTPGCHNYAKSGRIYDDELCPSCL